MNKKFELLRQAVNTYKVNHVNGRTNEKELLDFIDELEALSQHDVMACVCNEEDKHGWTEIKCCNECGKPIEDFWCKH